MVNKLQPISWQAKEYIVKNHNTSWYVGLVVVTLALSALAVWLEGWTFLILVILSAISLVIYTLRPPRTINYTIDNKGIKEEKILHPYSNFRAFGILKEGEHYSAVLIPKKRFGMRVKVYFPETSGEGIVDQLGAHLPMEEVRVDLLDKLVNFLRI